MTKSTQFDESVEKFLVIKTCQTRARV